MFSALHQFLIDDFAGIVFPRLDVNSFLYNGVCTAAERLSSPILLVLESSALSVVIFGDFAISYGAGLDRSGLPGTEQSEGAL